MFETLIPPHTGRLTTQPVRPDRDGALVPVADGVPRTYVHRAADSEVLLSDWTSMGEGEFSVAALWEQKHRYFTPLHATWHDPLLAVETIRQIGALVAHAGYQVPLENPFLMWDLDCSIHPVPLDRDGAPAHVEVAAKCHNIRRRGNGALAGLRYEVVIRHAGQVVATGGARYTCTSPALYRRLRAGRLDPVPLLPGTPVPPARVGREHPRDVVISPTDSRRQWQVRVDLDHPVLYDRAVDHIPGMVLIEASRQAAVLLAARDGHQGIPVSVNSTFRRYAELDSPCLIEATRLPRSLSKPATTIVTGLQNDEVVFVCSIDTDPASDR